MHSSKTIRSLFAGLLLFVFAFATTPKRYLHNLVANHKDTYNKLTDGKTQLSKGGTYCQCDNLVATSPFTSTDENPLIKLPFIFLSYQVEIPAPDFFPALIYFELRGPPSSFKI